MHTKTRTHIVTPDIGRVICFRCVSLRLIESHLLPSHHPRCVFLKGMEHTDLALLQLKTMLISDVFHRVGFRRGVSQTNFLSAAVISCSTLVITSRLERRLDSPISHVHRVPIVRSMYRQRLSVFSLFPVFLKQSS